MKGYFIKERTFEDIKQYLENVKREKEEFFEKIQNKGGLTFEENSSLNAHTGAEAALERVIEWIER